MTFPYPNCGDCQNRCVIILSRSKIQAKHNEPFCCYLQNTQLAGKFDDILTGITDRVMFACKKLYPDSKQPTDQSLRNLRGAWFETAISIISWNAVAELNSKSEKKLALLRFPNVGVIRWWDIFNKEAKDVLEKGLFASLRKTGIEMTLPNPDLMCVSGIESSLAEKLTNQTLNPTLEFVRETEQAYELLRGKCSYNSLKFGLSVKNELKPDRRYLIVYEGSLVKAVMSHLQMRFWDISFETQYYGLVHNPLSPQDRIVYTNPSIDSIVDVHAKPRKAVDDIAECEKVEDAEIKIKNWLRL